MRELVSELLPHNAAGIAVLAGDMSLSSWNLRAESISGYTLEQVAANGLVPLFEPVEVMQHILYKVQAGIPTLSEYLHLRHADGQRVPVVVQCSPQRHFSPSDCQIVIAFRELAPLQERLRRDENLQMLGRLASSLSHEIRNPLSSIFLHVDILEEELRQPTADSYTQMEESLAAIKAEISRLGDLVEDYLALARLTNLNRQPEALGAVVETFVQEIRRQLAERHIAVHVEESRSLGQVRLHRNAFRRVLLNLIQNAIDAMPQGGEITIRSQRVGSQVHLEVCDTGSGISAEHIPLLFTPFHTTKSEGTGLGLYVVQQIIAAHEGEITVSSTPGAGTTFTILLPLTDTASV
jgi:signal transduction histidine kinase